MKKILRLIVISLVFLVMSCSDDDSYTGWGQGVQYYSAEFISNPDHILVIKDSYRFDSYVTHNGDSFDSTTWAKTELLFYSISKDSIFKSILIDSGDCNYGESRSFEILSFNDSLLLYKKRFWPEEFIVFDIKNGSMVKRPFTIDRWTDDWVMTPNYMNLINSDILIYVVKDTLCRVNIETGDIQNILIPKDVITSPSLVVERGVKLNDIYIFDIATRKLFRYDHISSSFIKLKTGINYYIEQMDKYYYENPKILGDSIFNIFSPSYTYSFSIENDSVVDFDRSSGSTSSVCLSRNLHIIEDYKTDEGNVFTLTENLTDRVIVQFKSNIERF